MKAYRVAAGTTLLLTILFFEAGTSEAQDFKGGKGMKISSSAFQEGAEIPAKYSRQGGNASPPLRIENAPANAKSLALIMDDPDAPVGLFTHWLLWNIDPKTTEILEHTTPKGAVQGTNDYPTLGYGGPQPPSGTHRYYIKIFALDQTLNLRGGRETQGIGQSDQRSRRRAGTIDGPLFASEIAPPRRSNKELPVIVLPEMGKTIWKIGGREIDLSRRGLIMGVLNVTPDSFSDGGEFFDPARAIERGMRLADEGAEIIDVGGESTRPGAESIPVEEELRRVVPVIGKLRETTTAMISIDTSKAVVARAALDSGAAIINDVTGGRADPAMMPLAAERKAAIILMHMQGTPLTMQVAPRYDDVVAEVADFFRQGYERALRFGIEPMAIAFDPGIGFGKTLEHNLELLRHFAGLRVHDRPMVVGVSRKAFLGKVIDSPMMKSRLAPTIALTSLLRARGANVFRVHDVKENVDALRMAEAVLETAK